MAKKIDVLDLGDEPEKVTPIGQRESIAFLLGAGFSIPMGYPTGSAVNKGILEFDKQPAAFSPAGELAISTTGRKPDFGCKNNYDKEFSLCKELINAYSKKVDEFDYERFMDVLRSKDLYSEYADVFEHITGDEKEQAHQIADILLKPGNMLMDNMKKARILLSDKKGD